jgi:hypothetical protein
MKTMKNLRNFRKNCNPFILTLLLMILSGQIIIAGNKNLKTDPPDELTLILVPYEYSNGYNVSCFGKSDGSINLTVSGGLPPYSYSWSIEGVTTEDISQLSVGYYTVVVVDQEGTTKEAGITLTGPEPEMNPKIIESVYEYVNGYNISCFNCSDGSIDLIVTGGSGIYTYRWNDGVTTQDRYGLSEGSYNVVIKDASTCGSQYQEFYRSFYLTQPDRDQLNLQLNPYVYSNGANVSCPESSDGSIDLTVTGGAPPYTYNWSNGANSPDINNLHAEYYSVEVSDANGSYKTAGINLKKPEPLGKLNVTDVVYKYSNGYNVSCTGCYNGSIDITVTGGSGTYTYIWKDGATTQDRTGLGAGHYDVRIKDASTCSNGEYYRIDFELNEPTKDSWGMTGNANTNPATQFIGTTDNKDLVIRTNDTLSMMIKANGNIGIGTDNPDQRLTVNGSMSVDGRINTYRITSSDSVVYLGDSCIAIDGNNNRIYTVHYPIAIDPNSSGNSGNSGNNGHQTREMFGDGQNGGPTTYKGLGIGRYTFTNSANAFAVGDHSMALNQLAMSFGKYMYNDVENSFMIGFNNTGNTMYNDPMIPTFFVGPSDANGTGKVGIGTRTPTQKFEVVGGNILVQGENDFTAADNKAILFLGDPHHYIKSINGTGIKIGTYKSGSSTQSIDAIFIQQETGNVGIGTLLATNPHGYKLAVNGTIGAREVMVEVDKPEDTWPDFVFEKKYELLPLAEVEKYINKHKHLPDVPSATDVEKNGLALGENQALLLRKIEELTLYIIEIKKENELLKQKIEYIEHFKK